MKAVAIALVVVGSSPGVRVKCGDGVRAGGPPVEWDLEPLYVDSNLSTRNPAGLGRISRVRPEAFRPRPSRRQARAQRGEPVAHALERVGVRDLAHPQLELVCRAAP